MGLYIIVKNVTLDISKYSYKDTKNLLSWLISIGYEDYKIARG